MTTEGRLERSLQIKCWVDRLFALILIAPLLPLGLLIAACIALDSVLVGEPPRILLGERRRNADRILLLLKFRAFRVSAWQRHLAHEPMVSVKALEKKPEHLTRVGRLLKRCYPDELPQLR